jgi:hypothetical protein
VAANAERPVNHDHWILTVAPEWKGSFGAAARALELLQQPAALIQENDRGTVSLVRHGEILLVVKRSKTQAQRPWIQMLSLVRGGEGARAFRNMRRLRDAGLAVPEPVLALEQVRWRFVVASWHAYRHLAGQPCTCADAALVARTLADLHAHGWVHRDPHVRNFLRDGDAARIIDCAKARPWRFAYGRRYDVVLLDKCCPGARMLYPGWSESDPLGRLARWHNRWVVRWRRMKRAVRGALGIDRPR